MPTPWIASVKQVRALDPVSHASSFLAPEAFHAPRGPETFDVPRLKLHAAMARTGLAANADNLLLQWRAASASADVDYCIDELTEAFVLSKDLLAVMGAERTAIVGRIGAGMCDLYMQSLGYVWRDQAEHQLQVRGPLADFIYEGPSTQGLGVALVEAKGSTLALSRARAQEYVNKAYRRQVEIHLGAATAVGQVIHGYAVGLRAGIGRPA